ncbi:SRPBCC domain-containing protein [Glycomyces albus]
MEYASIEREIHIDASPEVVFDVVSRPEHIREWWDAETTIEPEPGSTGALVWDDMTAPITVVAADPPRNFTFRWTHPEGESANKGNSLLVTFELVPSSGGTTLRMTETGFRERGWEIAALEEQYREHVTGWDLFVPRIKEHAEQVGSAR